jgi:hypothetical protein
MIGSETTRPRVPTAASMVVFEKPTKPASEEPKNTPPMTNTPTTMGHITKAIVMLLFRASLLN